jgi:multiple sugar transport system permease protein
LVIIEPYADWGLLMAASTMVVVPVIIVFFFAQKQFIQGIVLTGLKS